MNERLARWNERYGRGEEVHAYRPSPPLPAALAEHASQPGLALDVACGAGRHALYLAEKGWQVVAVDGSSAGLALLAAEAERRGLADRIRIVEADLTTPGAFVMPPDHYDLVCDFYYLDRARLPEMLAAVKPGGLFVAAIHVAADHRFLMQPGELRATVERAGLVILDAHEGATGESGHNHATATVVARRAPA